MKSAFGVTRAGPWSNGLDQIIQHLPAPSNRSPLEALVDLKGAGGDLLEGAGTALGLGRPGLVQTGTEPIPKTFLGCQIVHHSYVVIAASQAIQSEKFRRLQLGTRWQRH